MSKKLYGYVRGLNYHSDSCEWIKPELYSHSDKEFIETRVNVGDDCNALLDYLDVEGREIDEIANEKLHIFYKIIPLSQLLSKYHKEKKAFKKLCSKNDDEDIFESCLDEKQLLERNAQMKLEQEKLENKNNNNLNIKEDEINK